MRKGRLVTCVHINDLNNLPQREEPRKKQNPLLFDRDIYKRLVFWLPKADDVILQTDITAYSINVWL